MLIQPNKESVPVGWQHHVARVSLTADFVRQFVRRTEMSLSQLILLCSSYTTYVSESPELALSVGHNG